LLLLDGLTFGGSELSGLHVRNVLEQLLSSLVSVVQLLLATAGIAGGGEFFALLVNLDGEFRVLALRTEYVLGDEPS
jgi:hypothetical protein